jgi:hypothetical protein
MIIKSFITKTLQSGSPVPRLPFPAQRLDDFHHAIGSTHEIGSIFPFIRLYLLSHRHAPAESEAMCRFKASRGSQQYQVMNCSIANL